MPENGPSVVVDIPCDTGENPLWNTDDERLYWCDIPQGTLYAYDPLSKTHELVYEDPDERIGGFTFQTDGTILLFQEAGAVRRLHENSLETVVEPDPEEFHERFNDVIADPEGRVYCGVMPDPGADRSGRLYRLDCDGHFTCLEREINLPNGFGFTPDRSGLYFTDTCYHNDQPGIIYRYSYDQQTGELSDRTVVLKANPNGLPDGMTVDEEGYIWSAFWDGHKLVRYTPDGERDQVVRLEPKKVSSITFGGVNSTDAYVTTAGGYDRPAEGATAGSLFRVDLGVGGRPEFRSAIDI